MKSFFDLLDKFLTSCKVSRSAGVLGKTLFSMEPNEVPLQPSRASRPASYQGVSPTAITSGRLELPCPEEWCMHASGAE